MSGEEQRVEVPEPLILRLVEDVAAIKTRVESLDELWRHVNQLKADHASAERGRAKFEARVLTTAALLGSAASWLASRLFALVILLAAASCLLPASGPNGADQRWFPAQRPVAVLVDPSMTEDCLNAALEGLAFWQDRVEYLAPRSSTSPAKLGEISITQGDLPPGQLGVCKRKSGPAGRMWSARITLFACNGNVAAHELGHALGLEHADSPDDLMYPVNTGGWALSPAELRWVE